MNRNALDIFKKAFALPAEERAALPASALGSLETDVHEDAEDAWLDEVNPGVAEPRGGAVKTSASAEVRRRLAAH